MYSLVFLFLLFPLIHAQLNTAAKNAGLLYFGTATTDPTSDTAYLNALKNTSDFGQLTAANAMKWDAVEPAQGEFTFAEADAFAALAATNGQIIRCHNLVWHNQLPSWVANGTWTKENLTSALQTHITGEVTQYKGKCYAWDVVNEALNSDGTFGSDVFFDILGQDYIQIAFEAAAAADPDAKLYYNEFGIETAGAKSTAAQGIVKTLQAAGVRIDGVGFQSHFIVGSTPSTAAQVSNLEAFTALGVEVAITELDVRMTLPSTAALLAQQKVDYQTTTSACVAVKGCVGVTVWDFDDKYSWVPSTFPGTGAADLVDENVVRKPAYSGALLGLVGNATKSPVASSTTNSTNSQVVSTTATTVQSPTITSKGSSFVPTLLWVPVVAMLLKVRSQA